jgi:hypothetical protein
MGGRFEKLIIQTPDTKHQLQDETLGIFYFLLSVSSVSSVAMPALRSPQGEEGGDFAKQTQFTKCQNEHKGNYDNDLR